MIGALKTYFEKGKVFHGIEVYGTDSTLEFLFMEAQIKRKELVISKQCRVATLSELLKVTHPSIPLYVVYNSDGVITKIAQQNSSLKGRAAVEQLFPGLNFENFHYQIAQSKGHQVISIVKKGEVETLLAHLKEKKLQVVGLSLGVCSMEYVLNHVNQEIVYTHSEKIAFAASSTTGLSIHKSGSHSSVVYNINGLNIESTFLLPFSGILGFLSPPNHGDSNFDYTIQDLQSEFKNQRVFGLLLRTSLVFVLFLLLSNFLVFNSYFGKMEAAREKLAVDNESRKNLTVVRDRIAEKERKVEAVLSTTNSRTSFYLDRLASSVPHNILLTELQYQPLKKPMQISKPIELDIHTMLIMGTCSQSEDFSEWINHLEAFDWIKAVETMDYDYKNSQSSTFKIKIHVEKF